MIKTTFTEMEYRVIDELKEVYDPVVMTEEEEHIEFVRIGNAIGIEAVSYTHLRAHET